MGISTVSSTEETLNDLLVELNRSFLQYAVESWPYSPKDEATRRIHDLARRQQQDVQALVDLLYEREWPIDFGVYPTSYTSFQYTSLDTLLTPLLESQKWVVARAREVAAACADDQQALLIVSHVVANEEAILADLQTLVSEL